MDSGLRHWGLADLEGQEPEQGQELIHGAALSTRDISVGRPGGTPPIWQLRPPSRIHMENLEVRQFLPDCHMPAHLPSLPSGKIKAETEKFSENLAIGSCMGS